MTWRRGAAGGGWGWRGGEALGRQGDEAFVGRMSQGRGGWGVWQVCNPYSGARFSFRKIRREEEGKRKGR